jgi:arginine N-succinyltransferase
MPQSPIYVPLLPDEAQWALGQLHPVGALPFDILMDEGLDGDTYLNLFDGGPTADGRVALLKTVTRRRALQAQVGAALGGPAADWLLVDNGRQADFRATLLPGDADGLRLAPPAAAALAWQPGEPLWGARLDTPAAPPDPQQAP